MQTSKWFPVTQAKRQQAKDKCCKRIMRQKDRIIDDYRGNDREEKNERTREKRKTEHRVSVIDRRTRKGRKANNE